MYLKQLFLDHPASVGETYWQHFASAMSFCASMLLAALCCAIHALLPFVFQKSASRIIANLHDRVVAHRSRLSKEDEWPVLQEAQPQASP